jgi:hypothetical protein
MREKSKKRRELGDLVINEVGLTWMVVAESGWVRTDVIR